MKCKFSLSIQWWRNKMKGVMIAAFESMSILALSQGDPSILVSSLMFK